MISDDIYFDIVDTSKISSAQSAMDEVRKQKTIDEFRMKQQLDSPICKELKEQNILLNNQLKELSKQNILLNSQLEEAKTAKDSAKEESKESKRFAYISFAVGTLIGIAGLAIALATLFK